MSKKSIIARQAKRERAVAKYHDVRAQLKKDHDYDGLSKLPRDASPVRFAIFGGDINQDGTVDATDVSTIDNDAQNFVSGYVVTDLTGDDFVDGTDFAIADNNAANFVSVIRP